MPIWSSVTKNYTVFYIVFLSLLLISSPVIVKAADASNTTKKPEEKLDTAPVFEAGGFLYHMMPQISEKKPMTFTELNLILNALRTQQTVTQVELDLSASRKWTDNQDDNMTRLESTELYLSQTYSLMGASSKLLYGIKGAFPSNEDDRTAGFNYAGGGIVGFITKISDSNLILIAEPTVYNFTWQTSNSIGDEYNTKYSFSTFAKLSTPLTKELKWRNIARLYTYRNFAENTYQTISYNTQLAWEMSPNFAIYGAAATKDRVDKVTSTQKAFSRELVNLRLGLEWSL